MNTSTGLKLRDCSVLPSVFTPCRVCKRLSTPGWSLAEGSEPGLKPSLNNSGSPGWGMGSVGTLDQLHKDPQSNAEQKESRKPDSQSVKHPKRPVWTTSKWQFSLCWFSFFSIVNLNSRGVFGPGRSLLTAMLRLGVWIMDLELKPRPWLLGKLKSGEREDKKLPVGAAGNWKKANGGKNIQAKLISPSWRARDHFFSNLQSQNTQISHCK